MRRQSPPFLSEQTSGAADALKHAPTMTRVFPWQRFPAVVLLITAALIIAVFATWRYFEYSHLRLQYEERETNVYSNIRLFEIFPQGHQGSYQDQFYNKLKGTLYQMNQLLKGQSIMMNVYYQSIDQTLNYTFSLKSSCDSKQLAMSIYHWRIDINQLNNLILRETRRKIGEMEGCSVG
ncbi:Uncharacterised protein [Cedecea neteri]|uniref:Uncharacterized protein n=1 Tax=Cedecea neteri TaxID=158822 RepID=A0A2X2SXQ4_9ENTR|nr:Uncharacterised protein [Cedecea neteri]